MTKKSFSALLCGLMLIQGYGYPVLAQEDMEEMTVSEENNLTTEEMATQEVEEVKLETESSSDWKTSFEYDSEGNLKSGNYKLQEDVYKHLTIPEKAVVTIDLNGKNWKSGTTVNTFTLQKDSTLKIVGKGKIENEYSISRTFSLQGENAKLIIDGTIELLKGYQSIGIEVTETAKNASVEVKNATFNTATGILIQKNTNSTNYSKIKLENSTLSGAILQKGFSSIELKKCTVNNGIETYTGSLTVSDSSITGGTKNPLSSFIYYYQTEEGDIENSEYRSTGNAGIAITPTTKEPVSVTIKDNSVIKGTVALAIIDPDMNSILNPSKDQIKKNITINISNSTLEGTEYGIGYTVVPTKFSSSSITVKAPKKQQKLKFGSESEKIQGSFSFAEIEGQDLSLDDKNSSSNSSTNTSSTNSSSTSSNSTSTNSSPTLSNIDLKDIKGVTTENGSLKGDELEALETYVNKTKQNPNNYDFTVKSASVSTNSKGKSTITMKVTATLNDDSIINLVLRNLGSKYEDAFIEENEDGFLDFEEAEKVVVKDPNDDGKKVTIEGIAVEDAFRVNGTIDSVAIKRILTKEGYDVAKLDFSSTTSSEDRFEVKSLTAPISIEVSATKKPTVTVPVGAGSGSNTTVDTPVTPSVPQAPTTSIVSKKSVYRFFNKLTGEHFYTSSESERDQLAADSNWSNEGQGWTAPESSDFPIYRLCNPNTGEHHYTMNKNEYDTLATYGWSKEGIGLYSADSRDVKAVQLYRLYNPNAKDAGSHHYTVNEEERNVLVAQGWKYEGIAWHGLKSE